MCTFGDICPLIGMHDLCPVSVTLLTSWTSSVNILIDAASGTATDHVSTVIAEPKGKASNRDALSSPVCIYVCMYVCMYVYLSQST